MPSQTNESSTSATGQFSRMSARRLLVLGGIALVVVGMIFGDIFAVFVLHQNAARVGAGLAAAAHAALSGDSASAAVNFTDIGSFLENRGTKVDAHVHMIEFGYLALLLAVMMPWVAFAEKRKRNVAWVFLVGAISLPVGVLFIHYVGLARSPLKAIGWASIFADAAGVCVLFATAAYLAGLYKYFRGRLKTSVSDEMFRARSETGRVLLAGGLVLILLGFAHGAYYAVVDLYRQEALDHTLLASVLTASAAHDKTRLDLMLASYGELQGDKAVKIAAHAHIIEFGFLAMILSFVQPYVSLSEEWKRRWAWVLLAGSVLLPVCVLFELRFGLYAGALADFGGAMVILALVAMWFGISRYAGRLDSGSEATS